MDNPDEGDGVYMDDFAADVVVNILMRLPPNTRRLLRLVSRHWRDVVGTRTATSLRSRAKTLVTSAGSAFIVDDLSAPVPPAKGHRELWTGAARRYKAMSVVGTCNGLVCLCDDAGAITVANPVTRGALKVPSRPPPTTPSWCTAKGCRCYNRSWHEAYNFAHLPMRGQYKIVHVPCHVNLSVFDAVHVFTLGEASWQRVPASPAARCDLGNGPVTVDGVTYWPAQPESAQKVMAFDLEDERLTPIITSLPYVMASNSEDGGSNWHLAEVHGRLGIIFFSCHAVSSTMDKTEVWVMEGTPRGREIRWSHWYTVQTSMPRNRPTTGLTWPLSVHGDHVLTWEWSSHECGFVLYRHTLINNDTRETKRGVVDISEGNLGMVVAVIGLRSSYRDHRTFSYVQTAEPTARGLCCDDLYLYGGLSKST